MSETFSVKKIWATPDAEKLISYCARVSSPKNQTNFETAPRLLKYCIKNKHWSIFEMANMCVEIQTSRGISPQILRHRSFCFQEFSQRYAKVSGFVNYSARRQDQKNRQNSIDNLEKWKQAFFSTAQAVLQKLSLRLYNTALKIGIAKESARFLLLGSAKTTMYMNGTVRSWIHYLQLRTDPSTQLEHREVALAIQKIFIKEFPVVAEALGWRLDEQGSKTV